MDSTSYLLGIAPGQMKLFIKIWITWLSNNLLNYLPKYKFPLHPPVEPSGPQPHIASLMVVQVFELEWVFPSQ